MTRMTNQDLQDKNLNIYEIVLLTAALARIKRDEVDLEREALIDQYPREAQKNKKDKEVVIMLREVSKAHSLSDLLIRSKK